MQLWALVIMGVLGIQAHMKSTILCMKSNLV